MFLGAGSPVVQLSAVVAVGEGLSGGGDAALGSRQCGGTVMRLAAVL